MSLTGSVAWSTHPPGVSYPSDTNEISADWYLTVNYSTPGQVVVFNRKRQCSLDLPPDRRCPAQPALTRASAAHGDIFAADDADHRIIVVDLGPTASSGVTSQRHPWQDTGVLGQPRRDGPATTQRPLVYRGALTSKYP
jgi:hypothetical protein